MPCNFVTLPDGGRAIICTGRGRRPRCACGMLASLQCDWKVPERPTGTCDAFVCADCASSPAPGKDLCRAHTEAWRSWKEARTECR